MEYPTTPEQMTDLMVNPVFTVRQGIVVSVNAAAVPMLIQEGTPISELLATGREAYAHFTGGTLFLSVSILGQVWGASVVRMEDADIFILDELTDSPELKALSLAAMELRGPLSTLRSCMSRTQYFNDPIALDTMGQISQQLYVLQRMVGNMSDAGRLSNPLRHEPVRVNALFTELFQKAGLMLSKTLAIRFDGLKEEVVTMADAQLLERAAMNLIANAARFTKSGGHIHVTLTRKGNFLQLQVKDNGSGIPEEIRKTLFQRYQRQPGIEDERYGIGLGMLLVRNAAASHGGTVLVDQPGKTGTRVTLTIEIRPEPKEPPKLNTLRVDYAGEADHALLELSQVLPNHWYQEI